MSTAAAAEYRRFPAGYFTGETTQWEMSGVLLSEVRHSISKAVPMHVHDSPYLSLLLEGSYREWGADFDIRYEPYTLVFHSAGTLHADEMFAPCRFFAVALLPRWEGVLAQLGAPAHVFEMYGGDCLWLMLRLYREFLARGDSAGEAVDALVYELCAHIAQRQVAEPNEPQWLARIDVRLAESFKEAIDIPALASSAGVHPSHLCRAFRRFRGRTITDAVYGARVQHVARRLADATAPLSEIAIEAGFADQSHMTRIFKRLTGHPPGEHRRSVHR